MIALALILAQSPVGMAAQRTSAQATICSVHDGDSIRLCSGERVRLANIDAPEMPGSPRCVGRRHGARSANISPANRQGRNPAWCNPEIAVRSRDALAAFVRSGPVTLRRQGTDRYGRTLARVTVNGRDAGQMLIGLGLARRWR